MGAIRENCFDKWMDNDDVYGLVYARKGIRCFYFAD